MRLRFGSALTVGLFSSCLALGLFQGCKGEDEVPLESVDSTSTTCSGNDNGWYCATNPDLNIDPNDEFFDTDLVHCSGEVSTEVRSCENACMIKPSTENDVCTSTSSMTCVGNDDGWFCATNPDLNIDSEDEFFDTDLIHCVDEASTEVKACTYGCTVKSSTENDVCTPPESVVTCQGNDDGWYCSTNPDLVIGPDDELYDGDLIHCVGDVKTDIVACMEGCEIKPSADDACIGSVNDCGNGAIDGSEACDLSNMNGHTCANSGFNGGSISCTGSCALNTAGCCTHSCPGGTQCIGTDQQTCQDGNADGCNEWVTTGTCGTPTCTTTIGSNACYSWNNAAGGNQIFEICAEKVGDNRIRIHVRKDPLGSFGTRPYGMRVFGTADPECSHSTWYYSQPANVTLLGVGTNELTMEYDVVWAQDQTSKKYCAFASTTSSDVGYDASSNEQKIWWYSPSLQINKTCN